MSRLAALDCLRGVLLLMMAINHIASDLHFLSDQPLGYFSAAEGFVFLSGLLAGKVYGQRASRHGLPHAARAAFARVLVIYRAHLICIGFAFVWCWLHLRVAGSAPPGAPSLFVERPLEALLAAALFIYRPGLFDILPLYCVSLVLLPVVLAARRFGYTRHVWVASAAVWAFANLFTRREPYIDGLINTGAFPFMAWQFLFVIGAVLGVRWGTGALQLGRPRPVLVVLATTMVLVFAAARHELIPVAPSMVPLIQKINLAPLRLVNAALFFWLVAHATRAFPRFFTSGPLELLGRHSLPVFTVHIVVTEVLLGLPRFFESTAADRALGTSVLVASMFLTAGYAAARRQSGASDVSAPSSTLRSPRVSR